MLKLRRGLLNMPDRTPRLRGHHHSKMAMNVPAPRLSLDGTHWLELQQPSSKRCLRPWTLWSVGQTIKENVPEQAQLFLAKTCSLSKQVDT